MLTQDVFFVESSVEASLQDRVDKSMQWSAICSRALAIMTSEFDRRAPRQRESSEKRLRIHVVLNWRNDLHGFIPRRTLPREDVQTCGRIQDLRLH